MPAVTRVILCALPLAATLAIAAGEHDSANPPPDEKTREVSDEGPRQRRITLFPAAGLYRPYLADPHQVGFAIVRLRASELDVEDSGRALYELKLGGSFPVVRFHPRNRPERGLQLSLEAGFNGLFDVDRSYDNIGWDGVYGMLATAAPTERLALKLGLMHTSSHVGDEFAERTGRLRLGYTRQELALGAAWSFTARWRAYAEGGWGYDLRNEQLQEPGRAQVGLEYVDSHLVGRFGWYVAADLTATEERDWDPARSVQLGFHTPSGARCWRFGLAHYDGRVPIGEFFQHDERYVGLGVWVDL